jgi:hypothetical protein
VTNRKAEASRLSPILPVFSSSSFQFLANEENDKKRKLSEKSSVANPGWLSRIPDFGSKNSNKREGWKKLVVLP